MEFDFSVRNVLRKRLGILNTNQAMRHGRCVVQMHALSITPLLFLLLFVSSISCLSSHNFRKNFLRFLLSKLLYFTTNPPRYPPLNPYYSTAQRDAIVDTIGKASAKAQGRVSINLNLKLGE